MPILAMGGGPNETLLDYVLGLGRGPRVLYVPTAGMEDAAATVTWFERLRGRAEMTLLSFHPWPPGFLTARAGAAAYRVSGDGEEALEARLLA